MKIIIVGAGDIGGTLANVLSSEKHDIRLIEKEDEVAKAIANKIDALVIKGDATEFSILKDANIENADAVIAATDDDKTNLMVSEIAKSSNVPKTIARVNNPKNEELFTKLGIASVIPIVSLVTTKIKRILAEKGERIIAELGGGDVQVIEINIGEKSALLGKPAELKNAVIGTIYREGELLIPDKKTILSKGDILIVTLKTENISKVRKIIAGE